MNDIDAETTVLFRKDRTPVSDGVPEKIEDGLVMRVGDEEIVVPPFDDVFDGVPKALPEDITEKIESPVGRDEDWEEDAETVVRPVPRLRGPVDPTGCMM